MTDDDWYARYRREVEAIAKRRADMREATEKAAKWVLTHLSGGPVNHFHPILRYRLSPIGKAWVRKMAKEALAHKRLMESAWGQTR